MQTSAAERADIGSQVETLKTRNCDLSPILHPEWKDILTFNSCLIGRLMEVHGSPLHLVAPEVLSHNLQRIEKAIQDNGVKAQVYYAMKANKGLELVRVAAASGYGIDVASEHEFKIACELSPSSTPISLSGPLKSVSLFRAAMERNAIISIDSIEELRALRDHLMTHRPHRPVRINLRYRPTFKPNTRFGMCAKDVRACARVLVEFRQMMEFVGFHMHLSGYKASDRSLAVEELMGLAEVLNAQGLRVRMLNIGGGMPVQYVNPDSFETFLEFNMGCAIDYKGGKPSWFYPYGGRLTQEDWIGEFMRHELSTGQTVAHWLRQCDITLAVEPGRSALDQVAISLFSVGLVKAGEGYSTIFLNGSSFSASEPWFQSDFLCDPILLRLGARTRTSKPLTPAYYLAGHSCLEDDVIGYRPFDGAAAVVAGDVLVFINTAGYHMDLMENNFHHHPTPARLNVNFSKLSFTREYTK